MLRSDRPKAIVQTNLKLRLSTQLGVENEQTEDYLLQNFIRIELDWQALISTEGKIVPVSFLYFAGSLAQNRSLHNTN